MSSVDRDLLNASLLLNSDPAAASRQAKLILEQAPSHVEASLLLGAAYRKLGSPADAIPVLEALTVAEPTSATIRLELARAYSTCDRRSDAKRALQQAVELDDRFADAWAQLAVLHFFSGDCVAGDRAYARYADLTPDSPELVEAAGALADHRLRTAEELLLRRLTADAGDVRALRMLAAIDSRCQNLASAGRRLDECLQLAPGYAAARVDLVGILLLQQRHSEALVQVERLLAADPQNSTFRELKVQALRFVGRHDEALALARDLNASDPDNEAAWLHHGHLLRELGDNAKAIEMYRRALQARPGSGGAYWSLANLKTFRFTPEDLTAMRDAIATAKAGGADRIALEFALAKALEDEAKYTEAFGHYATGNRLQRAIVVHNPDAVAADVRCSEALYTEEFFAHRRQWGNSSRAPIFIVGLPRSGSTLLEQMLSSHSQIEATAELTDIPAITMELMTATSPDLREYPKPVAALQQRQIAAYADRYLSSTQCRRMRGTERFIDKMLGNFGHVGLIHLMFPNAAIIDMRRDAMANCFACYKQYFVRGLEFTYDLVELGRYYADYTRLMSHIDTVLPGRVHRVCYERLVAEPEAELRKAFDYCGLPFEERCLRYYEERRVVRTISSEQVRQPLYTSSIDQWRHFEPWLAPLRDVLGDHTQ